MNIKEAKEQIKNAMVAYFSKDENGEYIVPIENQRPVFVMGPPGIGKTAIMQQVASELGVGLLSYSMTHHTRQSALGLPYISHKNYGGIDYEVSEYTMSEIIASVYDLMEETGVKEGILFLDEINCVSETLAPIMLQFLQYKIFGRHRVPDGWIVVTAGNPPEYNNSVREFDIVTWDRLKRIDVEPDFSAWKEYAYLKKVHPAVLSYLEIKKANFYSVASTVEGKEFVTARGWDDLSQMIKLYEKNDIKVDIKLISQYVQNKTIAKDFSVYYDLYQKYKSDYQVDKIIAGKADAEITARAKNAKFDERLSLISLLLDAVGNSIEECMLDTFVLKDLSNVLKEFKVPFAKGEANPVDIIGGKIANYKKNLSDGKRAGSISKEDSKKLSKIIEILNEDIKLVIDVDNNKAMEVLLNDFQKRVALLRKNCEAASKLLSNMFIFAEKAFGNGQELLILVTELTINPTSSGFISRYGCKEYFKHNKNLLIHDRKREIDEEIRKLKLDEE